MRILLVEDDEMIGQEVQLALRQAQYSADWVRHAQQADTALRTTPYDAVLLDLGLPDQDGLFVLKRLRERDQPIPVIIVTAREAIDERIAGLDAGADDYVLKPFDIDELLARVRALIRRSTGSSSVAYKWGSVWIDVASKRAKLKDETVVLSAREWAVLESLVMRPGNVFSRAQLEEKLYGWGEEVSSNAIEVHIHNLRRKLGSELIRNVRGIGYMVPSE